MLKPNAIFKSISDDFPEEHLARLKKHNSQSFWIQVALAFILLIIFVGSETGSMQTLATWLGLLIIIGIIRLSHNTEKRETLLSHDEKNAATKAWVGQYILLTTFMSFLWGTAGFFLFPQEQILQATVLTLLFAVLLTTVPLLLASKTVFYMQFIGILSPVTVSIALNYTDTGHIMLIVGLIALATTVIFASNYLYQIILQLQDTKQALQTQADTDQLTKLANRRSFDSSFKSEWRRCTRENHPISLLIIDVDDFKLYNDTFGHPAGDQCLRQIAAAIKENARRPADLAARIGGEEFGILLPSTPSEGAQEVAERLQTSVSRLDIKHPDPSKDFITLSIGVSSCTPRIQNEGQDSDIIYPAMLVKSADHAMYEAKRQGKNMIVVDSCGLHLDLAPESLKNNNETDSEIVSA